MEQSHPLLALPLPFRRLQNGKGPTCMPFVACLSHITNGHYYSDYRGLKKRITTIRRAQEGACLAESPSASRTSLNINEARSSDIHDEAQNVDGRPGSSFSVIPPADTIPKIEQEGINSQVPGPSLNRRRPSVWTRRGSFAQQGVPSIKWTKGRSFSGRCATLTLL